MHVLAYTVRPKNTHRGSTKSMLLKPESGTLRQYFTGPIGVEYLVRGKIERSAGDRQRPDAQHSIEFCLL